MAEIQVIKTVQCVIQRIQVKVFEEFLAAVPPIGINRPCQLGYDLLEDSSLKHCDAVRIDWGGTWQNSVLVEDHSEKYLDIRKGIVFANRYTPELQEIFKFMLAWRSSWHTRIKVSRQLEFCYHATLVIEYGVQNGKVWVRLRQTSVVRSLNIRCRWCTRNRLTSKLCGNQVEQSGLNFDWLRYVFLLFIALTCRVSDQ